MAPSIFVYYLLKMSIPLLGRIFIVEKNHTKLICRKNDNLEYFN